MDIYVLKEIFTFFAEDILESSCPTIASESIIYKIVSCCQAFLINLSDKNQKWTDCGSERLVMFSCKVRGFCPYWHPFGWQSPSPYFRYNPFQ